MSIFPVRPAEILFVMSLILFGPINFVTTPNMSHITAIIITAQYDLQYFTNFPRDWKVLPVGFS